MKRRLAFTLLALSEGFRLVSDALQSTAERWITAHAYRGLSQ